MRKKKKCFIDKLIFKSFILFRLILILITINILLVFKAFSSLPRYCFFFLPTVKLIKSVESYKNKNNPKQILRFCIRNVRANTLRKIVYMSQMCQNMRILALLNVVFLLLLL